MSRRGSRSPDISAFEDRVIAQSERAARIRAECAAEAAERERRFKNAMMLTSRSPETEKVRSQDHFTGRLENRVDHDPCRRCGTRKDKHDDAVLGHRWRG